MRKFWRDSVYYPITRKPLIVEQNEQKCVRRQLVEHTFKTYFYPKLIEVISGYSVHFLQYLPATWTTIKTTVGL